MREEHVMKRTLIIASPLLGGEFKTGKLKWTGATDLLKVTKDNARSGSHSLLFDTNIDKSPTSRMVAASIGGEMTGTLEGLTFVWGRIKGLQ